MNTTTSAFHIDTYQAILTLKERGFSEEQAQGVIEVFQEADTGTLATKDDLRSSVDSLRVEMHKAFTFQTYTIAGIMVAQAAIILAVQSL